MGEIRLGDHLLVTTQGRDALADLRKTYVGLAAGLSGDFRARFDTLQSADELFSRYPEEINLALDRTVAAVARDIARERIYHWDEAALRKDLEERSEAAAEKYERIRDQYVSITASAAEREALRAEAGQNTPSVMGGGFGVEGAVRGMAVATAANAAIGLVHGAANAAGKAVAASGDRRKKQELLKDPQTREVLAGVLRDIAVEGYRLVADIVNSERNEPGYDVVTAEAGRRAAALAENVGAGRVPAEEVPAVLVEAIGLDPFLEKPWRLWVEKMGDRDGSLVRAAEDLGLPIVAVHKQDLFSRRRAALSWSTPEECQRNADLLEEDARFYGLPFDDIRREIESRAEALDQQRRTFNGIVYPTVEDGARARAEADEIARRTFDGVVYASEAEAGERRDIVSRTFRNKIYSTPNDADRAKNRYFLSVSVFYWISVLLVPFPAALVSLRTGFNLKKRLVAFGWLVVCAGFNIYWQDIFGVVAIAVVGTLVFAAAILLIWIEIWVRKSASRQG
ncbi:hypothetical protein D8I30_10765 [Brevundimonas naejangsanensis]|uniref:Uncharacterized protein n=1 Tax=Brevundimonas naejangsanensis TaxID=588932 RepID=A0A494RGS5_9CAUL|nr:hypothetical protein D8I30_10765 [Brevundimonas naejangsanensis]